MVVQDHSMLKSPISANWKTTHMYSADSIP